MVKIRLARFGHKKKTNYNIVVVDSRRARSGKIIEKIGFFNPLINCKSNNHISLNIDKVNSWKLRGCQVSKTVSNLIKYCNKIRL